MLPGCESSESKSGEKFKNRIGPPGHLVADDKIPFYEKYFASCYFLFSSDVYRHG